MTALLERPPILRRSSQAICSGVNWTARGRDSDTLASGSLRSLSASASVSRHCSRSMLDYGPQGLLRQTEQIENLNQLIPESCEGYGRLRESFVQDPAPALVRPVFRNIESELIQEIKKHDIVVGCVAWLTSVPILEALQGKQVSFVIQQEDWLRPDSTEWSLQKQRDLYRSLRGIENYIANASWCCSFDVQPIRLSGKPKTKNRSNARMHHKFVLFGKDSSTEDVWDASFDLLWTGSYNFTSNATKSLENGVFIKSEDIVKAYFTEWRQVLLSSFRIEDKWWGESYGWSSDDEYLRDGT